MSAANLIEHLDGVRATGDGRWIARCPAHDDSHPSLSVRELADGRVLVHCFGGCSVEDVLQAAGVTFESLFPARPIAHGATERRPFPAIDALRCIAFEALVVLTSAAGVKESLDTPARDRLSLASSRIQAALDACGVQHG
jgi:hypothetical protein